MTVTCTIESRLGSSRLPGKALFPFYDTTVLGAVIANARATPGIDRVIVCTSLEARDAVIADYATAQGAEVFRGDEDNVAGRISAALAGTNGTNIFLTGDNPLVTPDLMDRALGQFQDQEPDYLCSTHMKYCDWWTTPPVLPKGLSVQVARIDFFHDAVKNNDEPHFLGHSTMVMYGKQLPGRRYAALGLALEAVPDMSRSYTIDTAEEYIDLAHAWLQRPLTIGQVLQRPDRVTSRHFPAFV